MRDTGKVAIARIVLRSRERLVAIRPRGESLLMTTMNFGDEIQSAAGAARARRSRKRPPRRAASSQRRPAPGRVDRRVLRHHQVPRHLPRGPAGPDRPQGRRRGDRRRAPRPPRAHRHARPDGRPRGQPGGGAPAPGCALAAEKNGAAKARCGEEGAAKKKPPAEKPAGKKPPAKKASAAKAGRRLLKADRWDRFPSAQADRQDRSSEPL